jgi:hypothetical protein
MWATWYRGDPGATIAPRPVFHPELMVPLATPGVALKSRRNEKPVSPLVASKPRLRCVTVGGFPAEMVEATVVWFATERLETRRRSEEQRVESSYWIHVGPFENRRVAEQRLLELERLGVRDLLIMQDAQGEIAISLGLFSQPENAKLRVQELAGKGVEAKQEIRYRNELLSWFDLRLPEPADDIVARLRARDWGVAGIDVRDGSCPAEGGAAPGVTESSSPPR